ncbi:nicotinate phosphoribosyltransferase [Roseibacillus persicicus]|uniref:nicotinate phosphoribosyltransferase n=1 Tax=Roseibacillus persicicus TaxID=454148 RepID=UPI00398B3D2A
MQTPLLTDLYQLTMGQAYWHHNRHNQEAVFHLFFRRAPFGESAAIVAGIEPAVEFLTNLKFEEKDLAYLATLRGNNDEPLFAPEYLEALRNLDWRLTVKALPEGSLALANMPVLQVRGPILQCQLVETALLNIINFQTLIATQAARICEAAEGDTVLEFGLRRAQGPDGGVSASRAAYLGGCHATSNVLAGQLFGIPVKGTHAHSWVMSFRDESEAFQAYAEAMPNNTTLLVDTFDTIEGVKKAIVVARELRKTGHQFAGIRLDSGELGPLSIAARALLDAAGFPDARIVASNDLDVETISELKRAGAKIDTWGVGTKLVTAYEQPALGGVFKLGAIQEEETWRYAIKLSEDPIKVSNPGCLNATRQGRKVTLFNELEETHEDTLLEKILLHGRRVAKPLPLEKIRKRALASWADYRQNPLTLERSPRLEQTRAELMAPHLKPQPTLALTP